MTTDPPQIQRNRKIRHRDHQPRIDADAWTGWVQCDRQNDDFDSPAEAIARLICLLSDVCETEGVMLTLERVHEECCLYAYIDGVGECALDVSLDFVREVMTQMEAER